MTSWLRLCLYPEVKLKIIHHFVKNPELRQNQTQLARSTKVPQNTISRYIPDLVALRVLNEERYGKSVVYSLNKPALLVNHLLRPLLELSQNLLPNWVTGQMSTLPAEIKNRVEEVILFGSAARDHLTASSDIDLIAIVSSIHSHLEFELHSALVAAGNELGLKVNLQIESRATYESAVGRRLMSNIKKEGILLWRGRKNAPS